MPRSYNTKEARNARILRAAEYKQVERGVYTLRSLLREPPASLEGADLYDVLLHYPEVGRVTAEKLCTRAEVWPHRALEDLLEHEIAKLLEVWEYLSK